MRQGELHGGVEAVRVDALHELEALDGCGCDGGPEDGAGVVDEDVEAAICLNQVSMSAH